MQAETHACECAAAPALHALKHPPQHIFMPN